MRRFIKKVTMESTLGTSFVDKQFPVGTERLKDVKAIGLYFSAHWCPPCKMFTPQLAKLYTEVNTPAKQIEIIFVTSDKDQKSWSDYYATMPWLAIPFGDARIPQLKKKYNVSGIPTLVILDPNGNTKCMDAYEDVANEGAKGLTKWFQSTCFI
eukprot:TRINITY_DN139194_c0_g1_i1.p1 TRINITY_DN139194_c0_g1~~TRINITY_DN139194_c0_g1_i1.p1  ORF type:complete len:154 (-),score=17.17 TRINITY_DN139194_c0_g1_i1:105-566(-)